VQDPSFGWAAGAMISTPTDVNRFFSAVLAGKLLQPAQLAQMRTTIAAPDLGAGVRYGLGLLSAPLSCGGLAWGHGGDIPGYSTINAVTDDGRAATIAVTELPTTLTQVQHLQADLDKALCRRTSADGFARGRGSRAATAGGPQATASMSRGSVP
jgi:D-alanyl-D-alanine carboxypeptidase